MGKLERILKRKDNLMVEARHQELFCSRHQEYLTPYIVAIKRCYAGNHGKRYCKYIQIREQPKGL